MGNVSFRRRWRGRCIDPQAVALFRYGLIAEFLHRPHNQPGLYVRRRHKAGQDYQIELITRFAGLAPEALVRLLVWLSPVTVGLGQAAAITLHEAG